MMIECVEGIVVRSEKNYSTSRKIDGYRHATGYRLRKEGRSRGGENDGRNIYIYRDTEKKEMNRK